MGGIAAFRAGRACSRLVATACRFRNASTVADTTQRFILPEIPELFDPNFLDVLLPKHPSEPDLPPAPIMPTNPMMDALKAHANRTLTDNGAPAYQSTGSPTLDAFNGLSKYAKVEEIDRLLTAAWKQDPGLALRLIWNLRSIHDGKSDKEGFYRSFGWLYQNHPRTAIANLPLLVDPVCERQAGGEIRPHGYWKDMLNILTLVALDDLKKKSWFLHRPRNRRRGPQTPVKERKIAAALKNHETIVQRLQDPKFRALYIAVARFFTDQLVKDLQGSSSRLSLASKWAPTPGAAHDRFTNISSAIALLLYHSRSSLPNLTFPTALQNHPETNLTLSSESALILRSFLQRWVLTPLRSLTGIAEPLMTSKRWSDIQYNRVPSVCMSKNNGTFLKHDPERFENYLVEVEQGKQTITGATLLPHDILSQAVSFLWSHSRLSKLNEIRTKAAETKMRVAEAQWETMIASLRESGTIENSLAICDVSGSMGGIHSFGAQRSPEPIVPAIALSLIVSRLAKYPFNLGFISFSSSPAFVPLDHSASLKETVQNMINTHWSMNTDFHAVFVKLLLPLAIQNKVKKEDMIKRVFVFSDMQFDEATTTDIYTRQKRDVSSAWETNYDAIERAYRDAGYDVPEIVFWDLAGGRTVEVLAERKGVAMMSGFSAGMMKTFMGEDLDEEVGSEGESKVASEGESMESKINAEFNPVNVMKRALGRKSFDGLVVLD
ncbi:hypothetical protein C8J56DRAFT_1017042 [Mycena floridula]|nr:hypothetical protein C8J56DRAFT_1017042 [Mycena floridula]